MLWDLTVNLNLHILSEELAHIPTNDILKVVVGSDSESEPILSEESAHSPLKIASELEEKKFPQR